MARAEEGNQPSNCNSDFKNEQEFSENLDRIFDIAHQDAQSLIKISEDRAFLVAQREGRRGYMAGEDSVLNQKTRNK